MAPVWKINGMVLDDPLGRWGVDATDKVLPGSWSQRVSTVTVAGRDGVIVPDRFYLGEGKLALTILVTGDSNENDLQENVEKVQCLFTPGAGVVSYKPDSAYGGGEREALFVVQSLNVERLDFRTGRMVVSLLLPYPVWEGHLERGSILNADNQTLSALGSSGVSSGGCGPIRPVWTVPAGVHHFTVTCARSGLRSAYTVKNTQANTRLGFDWGDNGADGTAKGYETEELNPIWPDKYGGYRVHVEAAGSAVDEQTRIDWEAKQAWL